MMMSALSNSSVSTQTSPCNLSSGSHWKSVDQCIGFGSGGINNLCFSPNHVVGRVQFHTTRPSLTVHAGYSDGGGRPSCGSIFVGGFVLGGLIVGTLGCVYAPQISKAIAGTDKKKLMKKLPTFIYNEEKEVEKTRKILEEKIAQLNIAIDDASAHLRSEDSPNEVAINSDEIEAGV